MRSIESIYAHIEDHQHEHLNKLQEYLRQPSISESGTGIDKCARLLKSYYQTLGCQESEIVKTDGHPGVWAYFDAGAEHTFAVYGMYDVQPVDRQDWDYKPFGAPIIAQPPFPQVIVARGAYNSKGAYRLFLNALESIRKVTGSLPVNLMFISEGEEEIGSPHFKQIIDRYSHRLQKAEALLDIEPSQNTDGEVVIKLGNKGIVYLELICSGKSWGRGPSTQPLHSKAKAVVDSPAIRLVQALASFVEQGDANRIAIEGFYEDVAPPTPQDISMMDKLAENFDDATYARLWGVPKWADGAVGHEWIRRYLFEPSFNINGLVSGYTGKGTLTIIPHEASAKVDFRLVPKMKPEKVVKQIRSHLDSNGFGDVELKQLAGYRWNRTPLGDPAVQAMLTIYDKYDVQYEVWPHSAGSQPLYLLTDSPFFLPMLRFGLGHGAKNHAANEYLVVEGNGKVAGLKQIEKSFVDLVFALAEHKKTELHKGLAAAARI